MSIGHRMAMSSAAPKVARLYPDVEFPVPRGTPSLAELVSWKEDGPPTSVHTLIDEVSTVSDGRNSQNQ